MTKYFVSIFGIVLLISLFSCTESPNLPEENCSFDGNTRDSVFTDLVTFIYKPPGKTPMRERFSPDHRTWFIESTTKFDWLYCHVDDQNQYYYFMIRPARNIHGNKRGVGGRFTMDEKGQIATFEEILNTHIMDEEEIRKLSPSLFAEMVGRGGLPENHEFLKHIEFPNKDAFYDVSIFEWSYNR